MMTIGPATRKFRYSATSSFSFTIAATISTAFSTNSSNFFKPTTGKSRSSSSHKHLLTLHLKNRKLDEARSLFDQIPSPDVTLRTMMLIGYAKNHRLAEALELFYQIPYKDVVSWNSMIKGCLDSGDFGMAQKLFDQMPERNIVSWTTIMNGILRLGRVDEAESLFYAMPEKDVAAWNAMIHGYCSNGRVEDAFRLFWEMPSQNVISWTSMIGGLAQNGKSGESLLLFDKMVRFGVNPTSSTLVCGLTAAAKLSALYVGLQIHCYAIKLGYCFDEFISSALVTFYATCKRMEIACEVFHEMTNKNVVAWTALLTGYGLNKKHEEALEVFGKMMKMSVRPNESSFTSALNSCCGLEDLGRGKEIHLTAIKSFRDVTKSKVLLQIFWPEKIN